MILYDDHNITRTNKARCMIEGPNAPDLFRGKPYPLTCKKEEGHKDTGDPKHRDLAHGKIIEWE